MASVYVLYSQKLDKYYVGSCVNLLERIVEHNTGKYKSSYTAKASDWVLFFSINDLAYNQARSIENHIKKMKSRKFILNLKKYESISGRLVKLYS